MGQIITTIVSLDPDNGHTVISNTQMDRSWKSKTTDVSDSQLEDVINDSISHVQTDIHRYKSDPRRILESLGFEEIPRKAEPCD